MLPTAYVTNQNGGYRIQNSDAAGYAIWVGVNSLPDLTQPYDSFSATLPVLFAHALPGSGTQTIYVIPKIRDSYGVYSENQHPYILTLTSSGQVFNPIIAPYNVRAYTLSTSALKITGNYPGYVLDDNPADQVKIWVDADPNSDPATYTSAVTGETFQVVFGSYSPGTYTLKVGLFRSVDSTVSSIVTLTIVFPALLLAPKLVSL